MHVWIIQEGWVGIFCYLPSKGDCVTLISHILLLNHRKGNHTIFFSVFLFTRWIYFHSWISSSFGFASLWWGCDRVRYELTLGRRSQMNDNGELEHVPSRSVDLYFYQFDALSIGYSSRILVCCRCSIIPARMLRLTGKLNAWDSYLKRHKERIFLWRKTRYFEVLSLLAVDRLNRSMHFSGGRCRDNTC